MSLQSGKESPSGKLRPGRNRSRRSAFGAALALFAGFFLYIGASDLIPESYHAHPKFLTTFMTLAGAAVLYIAIALIR